MSPVNILYMICILAAISGCRSGFVASELDAPEAVKERFLSFKGSPLALAMSEISSSPSEALESKLAEKELLVELILRNRRDLGIYADYLKIKGYGVFLIDTVPILDEARNLKFTDEEISDWILGIIDREAKRLPGKPVAVLSSAQGIKNWQALAKIKSAHLIIPRDRADKKTLLLPRLSLRQAEELIDDVFKEKKADANLLKDTAKIAVALDESAFSIGLLDELIENFLKIKDKNSVEKELLMRETLRKIFDVKTSGLMGFIDSFSSADVEKKLREDGLWFYKNFQKYAPDREGELWRSAESRAQQSLIGGRDIKNRVNEARTKGNEALSEAKKALLAANAAKEAQKDEMAAINQQNIDNEQFISDKKEEIDALVQEFRVRLDDLIKKIISDINIDVLANKEQQSIILKEKINQIQTMEEMKKIKDTFESMKKLLDSEIQNAKISEKRKQMLYSAAYIGSAALLGATGPAAPLASLITATTAGMLSPAAASAFAAAATLAIQNAIKKAK